MIRRLVFKWHGWIGLAAGLVLLVMGVSGAGLSFESELLRALNPGVLSVTPPDSQPALPLVELLQRVESALPDRQIASVTLSREPTEVAWIGLQPLDGGRRLDNLKVNPYTGERLAEPVRGQAFFRWLNDLHRRLAAGDTGKAITGAAALLLIVICLSGLYLRWPKRRRDWRYWFWLNTRLQGRAFLWQLHAVAGTWLLLLFLVSGLTGLYWSYDWYREALYSLAGTEPPPRNLRVMPPVREPTGQEAASEQIGRVWPHVPAVLGDALYLNLRLAEGEGQAVQVLYQTEDSPFTGAFDRLELDARSGVIRKHQRFADQPLAAQVMSSILAVHTGRILGLPGRVLMMLSSLSILLFAVTGWLLYWKRRRAVRGAVSAAG